MLPNRTDRVGRRAHAWSAITLLFNVTPASLLTFVAAWSNPSNQMGVAKGFAILLAPVAGIAGLALGHGALHECKKSENPGPGTAVGALVLGYAQLIISVLLTVLLLIVYAR